MLCVMDLKMQYILLHSNNIIVVIASKAIEMAPHPILAEPSTLISFQI